MFYLAICGYITFISGERMAFARILLFGMWIFMVFSKNNKIFIFISIILMFFFFLLKIRDK